MGKIKPKLLYNDFMAVERWCGHPEGPLSHRSSRGVLQGVSKGEGRAAGDIGESQATLKEWKMLVHIHKIWPEFST